MSPKIVQLVIFELEDCLELDLLPDHFIDFVSLLRLKSRMKNEIPYEMQLNARM